MLVLSLIEFNLPESLFLAGSQIPLHIARLEYVIVNRSGLARLPKVVIDIVRISVCVDYKVIVCRMCTRCRLKVEQLLTPL